MEPPAKTMQPNDIVSDYWVRRDKIKTQLISLMKRNRTLGRYVYMKWPSFWPDYNTSEFIESFKPKRGPKPPTGSYVQWVMKLLHCSQRTAQDYILAFELDGKLEKLMYGPSRYKEAKEGL